MAKRKKKIETATTNGRPEAVVVTIMNAALDGLEAAVADVGSNRLTLPETTRLFNARKRVRDALREREELRIELVKQYKPDDREILPTDDGYGELSAKIQELYAKVVEVDLGAPFQMNGAHQEDPTMRMREQSITLLTEIGFLELVAPEPTEEAGLLVDDGE